MTDEHQTGGAGGPSWLERLSQALLGEPRDRQDLIALLRDAEQRRLLDADVLAMIEGALQVSEMRVRDIMIPRPQMVVVERDAPLHQILEIVIESAHSRFPVVGESRDEVAGILLAKDLLPFLTPGTRQAFNIRECLRPAAFVPESKRLNVLLREFRASRNHIAIVVDEYGGVAGLVTIEDVLEQIVGEIDDEHDMEEEEAFIRPHGDRLFTVKALTAIEDFNEAFGTRFEDEEYDTVGGLVLKAFGRMPERGESVTVGGLRFEVLHADGRRVHLLRVDASGPPAASGHTAVPG
jgi:magnesium and cobalt transporter